MSALHQSRPRPATGVERRHFGIRRDADAPVASGQPPAGIPRWGLVLRPARD